MENQIDSLNPTRSHSITLTSTLFQVQWDPMTGQWVSMGPLMNLMQQQQQHLQQLTGSEQQQQQQQQFPTPYTMAGYNLQLPPGGGGLGPMPQAAAALPTAGGEAPAAAEPEAPAPDRITLAQTFTWQVNADHLWIYI